MKILILEDEIPAYQKLISHLNTYFNDDIIHDWARSIAEGKALLQKSTYDVILSDIQLLDGISFDLFDAISVDCPIIFCSAHDEYLFRAFNTNGIAYILKPYSKEEFQKALEKYQSLFKQGLYNTIDHNTINVLKNALQEEQVQYKKRFVIKRAKGIQLLNVTDISIIEAAGDFCMAIDIHGKKHPIQQKIGVLIEQLHPKKFFRINRSQIVHIDYIDTIENHFKNRLLIKMQGVADKVMTSSANTSDFRKWIE